MNNRVGLGTFPLAGVFTPTSSDDAQKIIHKLRRAKSSLSEEKISDEIGQKIWDLVKEAESQGIDAESALRRVCLAYEEKYRR